jgi:hypothetical protein
MKCCCRRRLSEWPFFVPQKSQKLMFKNGIVSKQD